MHLSLLPAALLLASPALADHQPVERLRAAVAADTARNEALLQRLVDQNSGTLNRIGVRAVAEMMRAELEPLGFSVRWVDMAATGRAGHLIATHTGNRRGRRVLLIGHLDTVFEPTSPFQRFARNGNRATGPGVGDDKGGLVVIVGALRAMAAAGTLRRANITVVLTGDEERPGQPTADARADLIAAGKQADAALEYENLATEGGVEAGTVARRSGSAWELRTTGRSGHSSAVGRELGWGAIYEMSRILDAFRRELPEPSATFNVGLVAGGTPAAIDDAGTAVSASGKTNIVASTAIARGDLRTLTPEQDDRLRAKMAAIVAQHLPGTDATFRFYDSTPAMAPSPRNRALLGELNVVNQELGLPIMPEFDPDKRGAADSGFVSADVATLGGLGASGGGAHGEGEFIALDSLPRQALRSAALIGRLTAQRRSR
ncbi:M20/M25/M40 family metallo-hydrolase [Sphingomonas sp.]|uniref:M20/M25/M40 family metallo-hydrolase n=1 Tax=Sphingomonas sp. TaxID=28214 RepID=UPI003B0011A2